MVACILTHCPDFLTGLAAPAQEAVIAEVAIPWIMSGIEDPLPHQFKYLLHRLQALIAPLPASRPHLPFPPGGGEYISGLVYYYLLPTVLAEHGLCCQAVDDMLDLLPLPDIAPFQVAVGAAGFIIPHLVVPLPIAINAVDLAPQEETVP